MAEFWSTIIQQASGGSRTDVLRALVWPNALLLGGLIWSSGRTTPTFVLVLLSVLLVLFLLLYAAAFIWFGNKDPNLLRSEKFNIEKMAIERGLYGDDRVGLLDPESNKRSNAVLTIDNSAIDPVKDND
jgi:hypothetical protein